MSRVETIAIKILANEPLQVRSLVQDWLRLAPVFANEPAPMSADLQIRAIAAGVIELLASRCGQRPPIWANDVARLPSPIYLVKSALESPKLRERVERESPEPLRKRNVFAPSGYLEIL